MNVQWHLVELAFRPVRSTPEWVLALRALAFFAANGLMWSSSVRQAKRLLPGRGAALRLVAAAQLFVCRLILALLVLAAAPIPGRFSAAPWLIAAAAFAEWAVRLFFTREKPGGSPPPRPTHPFTAAETAVLSILAGLFLLGAVWAVLSPPPYSDAFLYHLTYPAAWLQSDSIHRVAAWFGDRSWPYFPGNAQLIYLWVMAPLRSDVLTNLVQWLALWLLGTTAYAACRARGVRRLQAILVSSAIPLQRDFLLQGLLSDADVIFAAFLSAAVLWTWLSFKKEAGDPEKTLAVAALALAVGVKHLGLLYGAPLLPFLLYRTRFNRKSAAVWLMAGVALGGWWSLWNWLETGNPIYPLRVQLGKIVIFPGEYGRDGMLTTPYHVEGWRAFLATLQAFASPLAWAVLLFGLFASAATLAHGRENKREWIFLFHSATWLVLFWFVNPNNSAECARFLNPAWAAGAISIGMAGARGAGGIAAGFALIAAVLSETVRSPEINVIFRQTLETLRFWTPRAETAPAVVLAAGFACFLSGSALAGKRAKLFLAVAGTAALAVGVLGSDRLLLNSRYAWHMSQTPLASAWAALDREGGDAGLRIAVTGTSMTYGYYGSRLQNKALYVSPTGERNENALSHRLEKSRPSGAHPFFAVSRGRFGESEQKKWLESMKNLCADFLSVERIHPYQVPFEIHDSTKKPIEIEIAKNNHNLFIPVFENQAVSLFKMNLVCN